MAFTGVDKERAQALFMQYRFASAAISYFFPIMVGLVNNRRFDFIGKHKQVYSFFFVRTTEDL